MEKTTVTLKDITKEKIYFSTRAVCEPEILNLCSVPYPKHPKGCPNYNKKAGCNSKRYFPDIYENQIYIFAIRFDFGAYLSMMRERHPDWTDRALRNPLYWQGHVRKELREWIKEQNYCPNFEIIMTPEAMGMNITKTCAQGYGYIWENNKVKNYIQTMKLEWPPINNVYAIAVTAKRKTKND